MELDYCPQCVDGRDNDNDGFIDYLADEQCTCSLDPSEEEALPPVPELQSLVLVGAGIAGLILSLRKK